LTQADTEFSGNRLQSFTFLQHAFLDTLNQPLCHTVRLINRRITGCQFRPTAQAGAKAGFLRRFGAAEEKAVLLHRRFDRADRTTIDTG
jgi:hypothetical protein